MVMLLGSFRRSTRGRILRIFLLLSFFFNSLDVLQVHRSLSLAQDASETPPRAQGEKVFIASTHWNNEAILRSHWNSAVVALAEHFGPSNVYVSIYESGSWDNSKGALLDLGQSLGALGVQNTIVLEQTTHTDEVGNEPGSVGWIDTPRGKRELRRIPYLARLRNESLKPLEKLADAGEKFDKILFLNDVVFTTKDVLNLLSTNHGHYAAACALDFSKPPSYYDTFALRDSDGHETVMDSWPYFRARRSRHAMKSGSPVPVRSCWNGMVFMPASPFYTLSPAKPLRFRGIPDTLAMHHLEGSECCLIHTDNPLTPQDGVWLNPNVRVGYSGPAYDAMHSAFSLTEVFTGLWENRVWRWVTTTCFKQWVVNRRVRAWQRDGGEENPWNHCLINEMQVLVSNGWAHV